MKDEINWALRNKYATMHMTQINILSNCTAKPYQPLREAIDAGKLPNQHTTVKTC